MKKKLGLVFGGRSGEHEVSLQSALSIAQAVNHEKYELYLIAIDKKGNWYLADAHNFLDHENDPARIKLKVRSDQQIAFVPKNGGHTILNLADNTEAAILDVVFPIVHGTFGEDGALQGFFAMLNLPCVGADVLGSAVGMDKAVAKELLMASGIAVADYILAGSDSDLNETASKAAAQLSFPVFVKPACSGSSVGVYKATGREELINVLKKSLRFDRKILVEEAVNGREIECAILGNEHLTASVPGEIIPRHSFYSYEAKYIDAEGARLELPAKLIPEVEERVKTLAKNAYKALSCSGMARVDMFLTEKGELILNEINTLPGFTKISMYPKLMELSGIPYPELIDRLIELAIERHAEQAGYLHNVLSESAY